MEAAQRELLDLLDRATQRLLDETRLLAGADMRAPSRLPGWSRAHVLAQLASGADAMRSLLAGARRGPDHLILGAFDASIARSAAAGATELAEGVATSAMALRTISRQLPPEVWSYQVHLLDGPRFPASELLTWRLAEVELHHCDLGIGYGHDQWLPAFAAMDLTEPMRSQRAERLDYRQPESIRARSMARDIPPYRPGQPLPGSWIGRART